MRELDQQIVWSTSRKSEFLGSKNTPRAAAIRNAAIRNEHPGCVEKITFGLRFGDGGRRPRRPGGGQPAGPF